MAGATVPDNLDGASLLPLLRGQTDQLHDEFYFYRGEDLWAIRSGPYKLHFRTQSAYVGDKPVDHDPPPLFHLLHDPGGSYDIA